MEFISQPERLLHGENDSEDIQLNKEIFGISAHLTATAQSGVEMKIQLLINDKLVFLLWL